MATITIKYADRASGTGHEHITHIGSATQRFTKAGAIRRIENKTDTFHVDVNGKTATIKVVDDRVKGKYLRTYADNTPTDNLLSLPACPSGLALVD